MRNVTDFLIRGAIFTGNASSETALELIQTTSQIANVTFVSNVRGKFKIVYGLWSYSTRSDWVGGAIIATNSNISISQNTFAGNRARYGGAILQNRTAS